MYNISQKKSSLSLLIIIIIIINLFLKKIYIPAIYFSQLLQLLQPHFVLTITFFIRTLFWVILVSLERLESVEYKYSHKEHFRNYEEGVIFKMLQLIIFFLYFLLITCSFEAQME